MKAVILHFRGGRKNKKGNQFLIQIEGIDTRAKAAQVIGKKLVWKSPADKEIHGKITQPHGNNGVIRARFTRGLPGDVLGKTIELLET